MPTAASTGSTSRAGRPGRSSRSPAGPTRRYFFDLARLNKAPIGIKAVARIDALFAIEREINGHQPAERRNVRQDGSKPLVDTLSLWLREQHTKVSPNGKTDKAIAYSLNAWDAGVCFLDDGRLCMSNNAAERTMRPVATGRRNWTFAGSDEGGRRAAAIDTLIETAKLNDTDRSPGSQTSSHACRTIRPNASTNSCPGTGDDSRINAPLLDLSASTPQAAAFTGCVRSLFFEGISTTEVAKDYFMFNAVEGGALVREPEIGIQGSNSLFMNGQFDWVM